MQRCRTKEGELRLYYEGKEFLLDCSGSDLPNELAESIRSHVNVLVDDPPVNETFADVLPAGEPLAESAGAEEGEKAEPGRSRRGRRTSGGG